MVFDEFTRLKTVILGNPIIPDATLKLYENKYPKVKYIYNEIIEDFEHMKKIFNILHIDYIIPQTPLRNQLLFGKGLFNQTDFYRSMKTPRDLTLLYGNLIIDCPSDSYARIFETQYLYDYFNSLDNMLWIKAPLPKLENYTCKYLNIGYTDYSTINGLEILFDGAQLLKCGKHIFMNIYSANNINGYNWLKRIFSIIYPETIIIPFSITHHHLDGMMAILRPGLLLLNNSVKNYEHLLPNEFLNWDKIYYGQTTSFNDNNLAIGTVEVNILSVNEDTIIVDEDSNDLIKMLENHKFTVIPAKLRNSWYWGGKYHCITLDVDRAGEYIDYFK